MSQRAATAPAGRPAGLSRWIPSLVWIAVATGAMAAFAFAYFLYRGDPAAAARIAHREIEAELRQGEPVLQRVPVRRRYWWDYLRITHGILAATDRRLIYVGVPPAPLLPLDDGPPELDVSEYVYAVRPALGRSIGAFGAPTGVTIISGGSGGSRDYFGVAPGDGQRLNETLGILDQAVARMDAAAEAERRAAEAAAAAARRAVYHLVQRGEALELIARRYGVPVDSLLSWNGLTNTRIVAGTRLLVRPEIK